MKLNILTYILTLSYYCNIIPPVAQQEKPIFRHGYIEFDDTCDNCRDDKSYENRLVM